MQTNLKQNNWQEACECWITWNCSEKQYPLLFFDPVSMIKIEDSQLNFN